MDSPLVFAVILNTNRREDTLACLSSLFGSTYSNIGVIVLDNRSTDGSVEAIRTTYPDVQDASSPEDVRIMCPLNEGGMCVLYEHRPMICRVHGVPYEMVGDDGSVEFGSGCHRFMKERVWETTQYFMFNRTMFYREMAKIERDVRASLGFSGERRKTVADMLVDMCGR